MLFTLHGWLGYFEAEAELETHEAAVRLARRFPRTVRAKVDGTKVKVEGELTPAGARRYRAFRDACARQGVKVEYFPFGKFKTEAEFERHIENAIAGSSPEAKLVADLFRHQQGDLN